MGWNEMQQEHPGHRAGFRAQLRSSTTGNCRGPRSVCGDDGDRWASDRQDFELISPPAQQWIRCTPRIITRLLFVLKESARSLVISVASWAEDSTEGESGKPKSALPRKGFSGTQIQNNPPNKRRWGKKKNYSIYHRLLLLVPKAAVCCLASDSIDWLLRLEDKKQSLCLATASYQEIVLLCQKLNRDPTDMGTE